MKINAHGEENTKCPLLHWSLQAQVSPGQWREELYCRKRSVPTGTLIQEKALTKIVLWLTQETKAENAQRDPVHGSYL